MLADLKKWSDAHPTHLPIFIMIESKEQTIADQLHKLRFTKAIPFSPVVCDDIDKEIKSVFGDSLKNIITPDKVRGHFATLNEAVLANNWPTLGEARGKFLFVMMGPANPNYLADHPSLQGRAMFTYSFAGKPEAAFIQYDTASISELKIKDEVQKGYIIRTRADEPNHQNRTCDYTKMNKAFNSGAQIISTDYYRADPRYKTKPKKFKNYSCKFPDNELARINSVSAADKQTIGKIKE